MKINTKLSFTKTQIIYFFLICIAVLRAIQFNPSPSDNIDLVRHFAMFDLIKKSPYSLFEYVFLYGWVFTTNISMAVCFSFNLVAYLTAKYIDNYFIVAWLFVFVDYLIVSYIGIDWWKGWGRRDFKLIIFEILFCFSLLPFIHVVSGLRTGIASCIMALAIYYYLCKNSSLINFIFISFIAITFHPVVTTAIPFAVLAKKVERKKGIIITLIGCATTAVIARIMILSSNPFLYAIAYKYLSYSSEDGYSGTRFPYYGVIVVSILAILYYFIVFLTNNKANRTLNNIDSNKFESKNIYNFLACYMIYIISNIGSYEMVLRPAYLIGALAPVFTGMMFSKRKISYRKSLLAKHIIVAMFMVLLYVSFMYLIWQREYFM